MLHSLNLVSFWYHCELDSFFYLVHHQESRLSKMLVSPEQEYVVPSHFSKVVDETHLNDSMKLMMDARKVCSFLSLWHSEYFS